MIHRIFLSRIILMMPFIWFIHQHIDAQENFYLKTYTTENGLSHNDVRDIAQDQTGFLWIATWDGLCRYDGYEFKKYYHDPKDSNSIPNFIVKKICVDKENRIWILTSQYKIARYDRKNDNFPVVDLPVDSTHLPVKPTYLFNDNEGNPWITCNNSIFKYENGKFTNLPIMNLSKAKNASGFSIFHFGAFDNHNHLWLFDNADNLYQCSIKFLGVKKEYVIYIDRVIGINSFYNQQHKNHIDYANSFRFYCSPSGKIWFFSQTGIYLLDTTRSKFITYNDPIPSSEFQPGYCCYWRSTNNKMNVHLPGKDATVQIILEKNQYPEAVFVDNSNTVWYSNHFIQGTSMGLSRYSLTPEYFTHYLLSNNPDNAIAVFCLLKDRDNNLWVGARPVNYFFKISPRNEITICNELEPGLFRRSFHPRSMIEDSTGIWIGYLGNAMRHYDYRTGKFITIDARDNGYNNLPDSFRKLFFDEQGNIIIAGTSGLFRYDIQTGKLKIIEGTQNCGDIYDVEISDRGYWIAKAASNIKLLDRHFKEIYTTRLCKTDYNVEDILVGDHSDLWIALLGGGLCHLDPGTGKKEFYTTANGLSNNTTYNLLKDKQGNLWVSTNKGISSLNPVSGKIKVFGKAEGLKIEEFNADAAFQDQQGRIYFGGVGGIVSFHPDSIYHFNESDRKYPLVITELKVSGIARYFEKAIYELKNIRLNRGDDNFQVSFACLDFIMADKINYRYRLTGYNSHWMETDNMHRFIHFANLKPGRYRLEVEATDQEGGWGIKTSLDIHIPAFYYQTIWFKILVIFIIVFSISLFLYMFYRQVRLNELKKQEQLKLESLRGQMNPHFIFNSLNSINYFISQSDRLSANRYIADFSRLIRSILNNLSCEYIPFDKELESIREYLNLEHLRFGDKFDYKVELSESITADSLQVFPGLVQPFIENAIWHGIRGLENHKGYIRVEFNVFAQNKIICIVEDDGVGRKLSMKKNNHPHHRSKGMQIVNERMQSYNKLHNTNCTILIEDLYSDKEETGTRVLIEIPAKEIVID